ncbi:MAG: hypothetical protein J4478_02550 [Candidatus Diapherotrites archaeon]|uniref:Uncharacterized protein n=1 Tax=Candidatus Iainarchaeum sp. TaxID=3101447 RepID=A0A8T4KYJ4_9ARCH|nr:hypothetical protein [Candidatus Diapherotrites archaeon]
MEEKAQTLVYSAIAFLSVLAASFFLNASGIQAVKLASLEGISSSLKQFLSLEFAGLLVSVAIAFAIANTACLRKSRNFAFKAVLPASAVALIVSLLAFGAGTEKIFLSVFFITALAMLIETASLRKQELKKFITFRASANASQKAVLIIAIGLFASTAFIVFSNQQEFTSKFEKAVIDIALKQASTGDLADSSAGLLIQTQKQSLQSVIQTPQFQKLEEKEDADVQAFVQLMLGLDSRLDSPEVKESLKAQVLENFENNKQLLTFDLVKKQVPMLQTVEDFYWLIAAITITSLFLFLGNVIITPLAVLFSILAALALGKKGTG